MKIPFSLLLFLVTYINVAQRNTTIAPGEKLVFTASYNMSGLMTDLAQVTMETSVVNTSKTTLMRLKCTATTYKKWDDFFKIRDLYESYVNPKSLTSYLYNRDISEGGYYKFMQYKYSPKTGLVKSLKRKKRKDGSLWEEKTSFKIDENTRDLVTTLYHIRNLDIHKAQVGDSQDFSVLFDNKVTVVTLTYLKKETLNTKIGNKECYKLAVALKGTNLLKGKNENLIWLTADKNKIPVLAKFKIPVGNGELKIDSAEGTKY